MNPSSLKAYRLALLMSLEYPNGFTINQLRHNIMMYIGFDERTVEKYLHLTIEKYGYIQVKKHNGKKLCFAHKNIKNMKPKTLSEWAKEKKEKD